MLWAQALGRTRQGFGSARGWRMYHLSWYHLGPAGLVLGEQRAASEERRGE